MKRVLTTLCVGISLSACSMYWTDGGVPTNKDKTQDNNNVSQEIAREQKDLYSAMGMDQDVEVDSYEILLKGYHKGRVGADKRSINLNNAMSLKDSTEENLSDEQGQKEESVEEEIEFDNNLITTEETEEVEEGSEVLNRSETSSEKKSESANDSRDDGLVETKSQASAPVSVSRAPVSAQSSSGYQINHKEVCASIEYLINNFSFLPMYMESNFVENFKMVKHYFCAADAENLKKLTTKSYEGKSDKEEVYIAKPLDEKKDKGSYVAFASATKDKYSSLDSVTYVNRAYCTNFSNYAAIYGPKYLDTVDDIKVISQLQDIRNESFSNFGCSYKLVSKAKIPGFKPEYDGVSFLSTFFDGKLMIEVNYLTNAIKDITDLLSVTIAYKDQTGNLQSYSYRLTVAPKTMWHDIAVSYLTGASKNVVKNRVASLRNISFKLRRGDYKLTSDSRIAR